MVLLPWGRGNDLRGIGSGDLTFPLGPLTVKMGMFSHRGTLLSVISKEAGKEQVVL